MGGPSSKLIYPPLWNELMVRFWAPSWKHWALATDPQQNLPLSWHSQKPVSKVSLVPARCQNVFPFSVPRGGGLPYICHRALLTLVWNLTPFIGVKNCSWSSPQWVKVASWADFGSKPTSKMWQKIDGKSNLVEMWFFTPLTHEINVFAVLDPLKRHQKVTNKVNWKQDP